MVAILGWTFDGSYEPVAEIAATLDQIHSERGLDILVHVDAATGGLIAPFLDRELEWTFASGACSRSTPPGHEYGLVYPGIGSIVWRDQ